MEYKNEIRKITAAEFFPAVVHMKTENWRLVQICASCIEGGYEMSYSFCLRYDMVTLRLEVESVVNSSGTESSSKPYVLKSAWRISYGAGVPPHPQTNAASSTETTGNVLFFTMAILSLFL